MSDQLSVVKTAIKCPRCGAALPADSLGGHCPRCLVEFALTPTDAPSGAGAAQPLPRRFGDHELLEEIARGGMGVVYRARQLSLNRTIALKMILAGEFASPQSLRRFHQEAAAAARLQHPNIVAIHEVGECEGQSYFTMEFIEGCTLAALVREQPLPARKAATLLKAVAEAVDYAHQRGVLHRDLKPSNILVDPFDQPRITDFGLARSLSSDPQLSTINQQLTVTGQALGSPGYISPEQAFGKNAAVGPASDVYSLGAILYHLLTGRAPFQGETVHEVLLQVQSAEPVPPRRLNPSVPVDLETICLKCLEKDPIRRYPSAVALAEELGRFLHDEPINARPVNAAAKLARFCRRRPAVAALSASVLLLLIVLAVGSTIAMWRISVARVAERTEREKSDAANRDLRQTVSLLELRRAEDFFDANDSASGVAHLAAILRRDPSNHIAASRLVSALVHRNWALPSSPSMPHADEVLSACFSPDGQHVLTASWDKTAQIWDAVAGLSLAAMRHEDRVLSARYSPDGNRIVTASADGTARIWNGGNGAPLTPALRHAAKVHGAEFSPDGRSVVTASADSVARIWNADSGELRTQRTHNSAVLLAHFSPDGERVVTGTQLGSIRIWSAVSGETLLRLDAHRGRITALAFSPNGSRLVSASEDGTARLWNPVTGEQIGVPLVHADYKPPVWHAAFSPDGGLLLTVAEDGKARVWAVNTGHPIGPGFVHGGGIRFGTFSPNGELICTASADHSARVWEPRTGRPLSQPLHAGAPIVHAAFSADGRSLVTASMDRTAQVWDIQPRWLVPTEMRHAELITSVAFSPRDDRVLTTSFDGTARLWNARSGQPLGESLHHETPVNGGGFSADGQRVVTAAINGATQVWDCGTGEVIAAFQHSNAVWSARFSPDGERVVTASADGTARVWNARDSQPITPPLRHGDDVLTASFSPDGRWVVTAAEDNTARVWNAQTGEPLTKPLRHQDHVQWAEFSPDGTRVVTASTDNTACIWEVRTSQPAAPLLRHERIVKKAAFSPDGKRVVTGSLDRTARVWDAGTGQALTPPLQHESPVEHVQFSPDGRRILTGGWNGLVRVWDSDTGQALTEWLGTGGFVSGARFNSSGLRIAAGSHRGNARVWDVPLAPTPVPAWLAEFAEAVAGIRLSTRGNVELVPRTELEALGRKLSAPKSREFYQHLALWFLDDPARRGPAPF